MKQVLADQVAVRLDQLVEAAEEHALLAHLGLSCDAAGRLLSAVVLAGEVDAFGEQRLHSLGWRLLGIECRRSNRQSVLVQLEQPDVGANPLFVVPLRPVLSEKTCQASRRCSTSHAGSFRGVQERVERLLVEAGLSERGDSYPASTTVPNACSLGLMRGSTVIERPTHVPRNGS